MSSSAEEFRAKLAREGLLAERISDSELEEYNQISKKPKIEVQVEPEQKNETQNHYSSEVLKFGNMSDALADHHHTNGSSSGSSNGIHPIKPNSNNDHNNHQNSNTNTSTESSNRDTINTEIPHNADEEYARALQQSLYEEESRSNITYFQAPSFDDFDFDEVGIVDSSKLSTKLYPSTSSHIPLSSQSSDDFDEEFGIYEGKNSFKNSHYIDGSIEIIPVHTFTRDRYSWIDGESTRFTTINNKQQTTTQKDQDDKSNPRKRKRPLTIDEEDVIDLNEKRRQDQESLSPPTTTTSSENNLLNMPIQSTSEGGESSDHPTLTTQNSKRLQQVSGGVNSSAPNEPTSPTSTGSAVTVEQNNTTSSIVNNKKTQLFSAESVHKHVLCINAKSNADISTYSITIRLDENSPYTSKSDPSSKQCQIMSASTKTDLKRLIESISDHTTLAITTVCFKKTLGERQKILPLSTKLSVLEKITPQKPVLLFINGNEVVELDYNNMYTDAGNELFREKKFEQALEYYNISNKHYPNDSRVLSNRALSLIKLNRFTEALNDLSIALSSDKIDATLHEKVLHRRAFASYELLKNLTPNEEITNMVNSLIANTRVKDETLQIKLHYLCMKDMHTYLEKVGVLGTDYATVMKKKEVELNDVKLVKSYHYLLHNAPKLLEYCLITKREMKDLKLTTVFPASIYSPENKDSSLIHTPLPFCSREWYDSEMASLEELFSVKLWKPFYDNNENINGKQVSSQELYKFILFTTFKYLLSKPDLGTLLSNDTNMKVFSKILVYLAFNAGIPPKVYLYINNKSDETKIVMREYIHQNSIEYVHIQVRDFHFIIEFKQPASSSFSSSDSSYGAKENRVKHGYENITIRVGDNLPAEILE